MPAYKRILLKLSGEALMGDDAYGINRATIVRMVKEIQEVTALGTQVAVVIGGGNIFRGVAGGSVGIDRGAAAHYTSITFDEALIKNLQVLDATAFALCRDQNLPLKVFSIFKPGALKRVVQGEDEGTLVHV